MSRMSEKLVFSKMLAVLLKQVLHIASFSRLFFWEALKKKADVGAAGVVLFAPVALSLKGILHQW